MGFNGGASRNPNQAVSWIVCETIGVLIIRGTDPAEIPASSEFICGLDLTVDRTAGRVP
jgi:hypothetical protein